MAKSKSGGTRSFIRGRIGSDVYSIGKDGSGNRQQVVRSLAEQVANPRSSSQMAGRMIMSTVMQAASGLRSIIDHSFDGLAAGQPSISEFIRQNYALLKSQNGQYNTYQEKGIKLNGYVVSKGSAVVPTGVAFGQNTNDESTAYGKYGVTINLAAAKNTVGDLKALLQSGSADDYITLIDIAGGVSIQRLRVNPALADSTAITAALQSTLFVTEGTGTAASITITVGTNPADVEIFACIGTATSEAGQGQILSKKVDGVWTHSACTLGANAAATNWATALATYPVGSAQFLNGGNL